MSAIIGALRAELSAGIADFISDMGKGAAAVEGFQKRAEKVSRALDSVGKKMSIAITAPFLLLSHEAIAQAKEMRDAQGQVNAALDSTGGQAGKTWPQLQKLAKSLQDISVFDDDNILRNVTANLLSFGNITGPTFDKAEKAVVNFASRLGGGEGSLEEATLKIGRALNDPIQGISALTRAGVQFTTQQKEQIKTLVQSGQGQKAQALILDVLTQKYDGAAEALRKAQPDQVAMQAWHDFEETIGNIEIQVLPALTDALKSVLKWFQDLSPATQKWLVIVAALAAALGPVLVFFSSMISIGRVLVPVLAGLFTWFSSLSLVTLGWVAALAAIVTAIVIFWKSVKDILHGDFTKAWEDAKDTASKIAADIKGIFASTPTGPTGLRGSVNEDTGTQGGGQGRPTGFDLHNEDQIKKTADAAAALTKNLDAMQNKIAHGLDDLQLPKSISDANALNQQIDDYVKAAQQAGVNTSKWGGRIADLRAQIEQLKQAGLAKEAQTFSRDVDKSALAVKNFEQGGLAPLEDRLSQIDDSYQGLHDRIQAQIDDNRVLAENNATAADAMKKLEAQLAALEDAHKKAAEGAVAQYKAEQALADLQARAANLQTANDIRDLKQATGQGSPISSHMEDLQNTADELAKKQIDAETQVADLRAQLAEAERTNDQDSIGRLTTQLDLATQYYDLISQTTAEQIDAAHRVNDAFKSFTDSLADQLSDMIANWSFDLKGLMSIFRQLAQQLFIKPFTESISSGLGGVLKGLADSFGGGHAGGGSLQPGQWGIAGENGPEPIWAGNSRLNVMSNPDAQRMFGGGGLTQVFNISTPDANSFRYSQRQIGRMAKTRLAPA